MGNVNPPADPPADQDRPDDGTDGGTDGGAAEHGDRPDGGNGRAPRSDKPLDEQIRDLTAALASERRLRSRADNEVGRLRQSQMNESERAVENARGEGRAQALKEAGARLAAAEFRAMAAGRLPDPAATVEFLDMSRFVTDDGEPDTEAIAAAVDKLAAAVPAGNGRPIVPAAPVVPNGPRPEPGEADWLRSAMKARA